MPNFQLATAAGVSLTESQCLTVLGLAPRLSATELARIVGLPRGATTTLVDRLEARGQEAVAAVQVAHRAPCRKTTAS